MTLIKNLRYPLLAALLFGLLAAVPGAYAHDDEEGAAADVEVRTRVRTDIDARTIIDDHNEGEITDDDDDDAIDDTRKSERDELLRIRDAAKAEREVAEDALKAKREEIKANLKTYREEIKDALKAERKEIKDVFKVRHEEIKMRIELKHEEFEEEAEEREHEREARRTEIEVKLRERSEVRVHQFLDRFTTILDAAIDRMYGLVDRIAERADAVDIEGNDTSVAREHLDLAVSELVAAEADLSSIGADIDASLSADAELTLEFLRTTLAETKDAVESAKRHIRAAHAALRDAIEALKAASGATAETEAEAEVD